MAGPNLVIGVDSSTQSTKAIAWDAKGHAIAQGRAAVAMVSPRPQWFEQDADDWWRSLVNALRDLSRQIDLARVASIAIANQRETLAFLDAAGRSVRPAMVWLDERGRDYLDKFAHDLGADTVHRLTGKPIDLTSAAYRIAWLRDHEPQAYARTAVFTDVQAYLVNRLTGRIATSWASSDPIGVFDIEAKQWSPAILAYLGLTADRFPASVAPGSQLGEVSAPAAAETGLPAGTPVFAGGGDGQCAGLGTACTVPGRAYVNLGTALVSGVWSDRYKRASHWRTLVSASGEGYILESVQRTGAFLVNWFVENFVRDSAGRDVFADLESAAAAIPIGSDGLLALPYWSGCMDPHWDPDARGCFIGLTDSHGVAHLYRAIMEGLTLESARAAQAMTEAGASIDEFIVIGGGAKSRLWVQMVADATDCVAHICDTVEASALGAGVIAAAGVGWYGNISDAAQAMGGRTVAVEPDRGAVARYRKLMELQGMIYRSNAPLFRALADFRKESAQPAPGKDS